MRIRLTWMILATTFSASAAVAACGGAEEPQPEYPPRANGETTVTVERDTTPPEPENGPAAPQVQVVAGTNSPIDGAAPALRVTSPRNGAKIRRGNVMIQAALTNWDLSPEGNHVHVILDNEPYIAVRDLSHPIDLNAIVQQNLGHELAPGSHVVRMFPSRGHHESVKTGDVFAAFTFVYQTPTAGFSFDARAPLLTFSRPKGCNVAGQRVLLDFYLSNVTDLGAAGHRVRYSIDGTVNGEITQWVPHYIENLPAGDHTVQLTLLGPDGQPVAGPFNDTTRTIQVAASCAPPAAAPAAGAATPTAAGATAPAAAAPAAAEHAH